VFPRLSIVIPVANGVERLEETLVSVLENRPETCEVIVVHPRCYDDPYNLGDEVRFVESARRANLVELANLGIAAAQSEIIHFLACGALVEEGWAEPALAHFDQPDVCSVTPAVLHFADPTRLAAAGVAYGWGGRRIVVGRGRRFAAAYRPPREPIGPTLAAAFYRASALATVGGLAQVVGDRFADLDVALTLDAMGYRTVFEPACHVRAAASLVTPGSGLGAAGWGAERCYWRHASLRCWPDILVAHPLLMIAETLADLARCRRPRFIGRLAAVCCAARDLRHHDPAGYPARSSLPNEARGPASGFNSRRHEQAHQPPVPLPHQHDHRGKAAQRQSLRKVK
jgi:hypothetical protein